MFSAEQIDAMTPEQAWQALVEIGAILPTLTAKAKKPSPLRDRLLNAAEAAQILGISRTYLTQVADKFPFTRRIGDRVLFSEHGIQKWISDNQNGGHAGR